MILPPVVTPKIISDKKSYIAQYALFPLMPPEVRDAFQILLCLKHETDVKSQALATNGSLEYRVVTPLSLPELDNKKVRIFLDVLRVFEDRHVFQHLGQKNKALLIGVTSYHAPHSAISGI
jgi:hypothetical protein